MSKPSAKRSIGAPNDAEAALVAALLPICGALLRYAYGAGDFIALVKRAYLQAAVDQASGDRRPNVSRLAVVTGMTRKEVATLLDELSSPATAHVGRSEQRAMRVVHGWQTDSRFVSGNGRPKRLPLRGEGATFESVVAEYAGDVTTMSVLRELISIGAAAVDSGDRVSLNEQFIAAMSVQARGLMALSEALANLGEAITANQQHCVGTADTRSYCLQSLDDAALFHQTLARRISALLNGMEQWVKSRRSQRRSRKDAKASTRVGVYAISKPDQLPNRSPRMK